MAGRLLALSFFPAAAVATAPQQRPAILFATFANGNGPAWDGYVEQAFAAELINGSTSERRFEVDFLDAFADFNTSRLEQYNALVLFQSPGSVAEMQRTFKEDVPGEAMSNASIDSFVPTVREFVQRGGGVMLFPSEENCFTQDLPELYDLFGVSLPIEVIVENNRSNLATPDHMRQFQLAYTEEVTRGHPVTSGVNAVWYPITPTFAAAMTGPVQPVDSNWTVLLRASPTTVTRAVNLSTSGEPSPTCANTTCRGRVPGVPSPAIFAVRDSVFGAGRVAVLNQWRQWSIGSGTHWLFDGQVMERGALGRASDMGRLLRNTLGWLADASVGSTLGGYTTPAGRWLAPNQQAATAEQFADRGYKYDPIALRGIDPAAVASPWPGAQYYGGETFRGLIGARTSYSDGHGSVKDFADAAKRSGLDFVVFLETFAQPQLNRTLDPATLANLKSDCTKYSDAELLLIPGFAIENQFGNMLMAVGDGVVLPPSNMLTDDGKFFKIAATDPAAPQNMTGLSNGAAFTWLLEGDNDPGCQATGKFFTVGYFGIGATAPVGMKMYDLRVFAIAAVKYYDRTGALVEDLTDDFKLTQESTIGPIPVAVDLVGSPAELAASVQKNHAATLVRAPSLDKVFCTGLRWQNFRDFPTSVSTGPVVKAWTLTSRTYVLGSERFVTGLSLFPLPISVSARPSGAPLASVVITNGRELFRRFLLPNNTREFNRTLLLDGFVHRNLVLEVFDTAGNTVLANAARGWKAGSLNGGIEFCSDHKNDCGWNTLGHGPEIGTVSRLPQVSDPGFTWDGSPPATIAILGFPESRPVLKTVGGGGQDSRRCMQKPMMEYTDESGLAVTQLQDRMFNASVEQVVNDGNTFGPYGPDAGATPLMSTALRYRAFAPPSTGPPAMQYPGFGNLAGHQVSLFRSEMTFKKPVEIESLQVLYSSAGPAVPVAFVGVSASGSTQSPVSFCMNDMGAIDASGFNFTTRIETGGWFAAWSNLTAQAVIFFNRAEPLLFQMASGPQPMAGGATVVQLSVANAVNSTVAAGQQLTVELASVGTSLHTTITSLTDVVGLINYLAAPTGLKVMRGTRQSGGQHVGLLDVAPDPHSTYPVAYE